MSEPRKGKALQHQLPLDGVPDTQRCLLCANDDPHGRYRHYLTLAQTHSWDEIDAHLTMEIGRIFPERSVVSQYVQLIMGYVKDQVLTYQNYADPQTGARLPWWVARQQLLDGTRLRPYAAS